MNRTTMMDDGNAMEIASEGEKTGDDMQVDSVTTQTWLQDCMEGAKDPEVLQETCKACFTMQTNKNDDASRFGLLAQLVVDLGPAFSHERCSVKVRALACLTGAVEGIGGLSIPLLKLLGSFVLPHAGLVPDDDDDDNLGATAVRDAAVSCLALLLRAPLIYDNDTDDVNESIALRLRFAKEGVKQRCRQPSQNDDYPMDHDNADDEYLADNVQEGLSTLSRAKRSMCFSLIGAAVTAIQSEPAISQKHSMENNDDMWRPQLASFATFAAQCLHGESDPRCLSQLLKLLHSIQITFVPRFWNNHSPQHVKFPTSDLFDAVASYYPIQFTPPPNDIHGLTKQGLHKDLMSVLCFVGACDTHGHEEGMLTLSTRLFVERLAPSHRTDIYDEDQQEPMASTPVDKSEALDDLVQLLHLQLIEPTKSSSHDFITSSPLHQMDHTVLQELADALMSAHAAASSAATTSTGEEARDEKIVANKCRRLVSLVAYQLELALLRHQKNDDDDDDSSPNNLWNLFVLDTVGQLMRTISSSPQSLRGRTAIAYLSSLAACGGQETLRTCLDASLSPLLSMTDDTETKDEERLTAAIYGLGALVSSCRVSMETASERGVHIHPHPLQPFGGKLLQALSNILEGNLEISTRIASVRALESILLTIPSSILSQLEMDMVQDILSTLASGVTVRRAYPSIPNSGDESIEQKLEDSEWKSACSRTIGSIIGRSLHVTNKNDEATCVVDDNAVIRQYMEKHIFPDILSSSSCPLSDANVGDSKIVRQDWMALAFACRTSKNVSERMISELVTSLAKALKAEAINKTTTDPSSNRAGSNNTNDSVLLRAQRLSLVLRKGGPYVCEAFHTLETPKKTLMDIIKYMCLIFTDDDEEDTGKRSIEKGATPNKLTPSKRGVLQVGMSQLMLPAQRDRGRASVEKTITRDYTILSYILPAFRKSIPTKQRDSLIQFTYQVLPPLSEVDEVKLCVSLPLLAAALGSSDNRSNDVSNDLSVHKSLATMLPSLVEYALSPNYDNQARSAAVSCLFSIVFHYQPNRTECLAQNIIKDTLAPVLSDTATALHAAKDTTTVETALTAFSDALDVFAIMASATACRGVSSSKTADMAVQFLVSLLCNGTSTILGIPVSVVDDSSKVMNANRTSIIVASAFGSLLSVENGGPFWRQRMSSLSLPSILEACNNLASSPTLYPTPPLGPLLAVCHVVCCVPPTAMTKETLASLCNIIIRGLVNSNETSEYNVGDNTNSCVQTNLLAAILKLQSSSPDMISPLASVLITNMLVLCGATVGMSEENVPFQLMALQCLMNVTALPNVRHVLQANKELVSSFLAATIDHPSHLIRHSAVHVRNAWCVLE